MTGLVFIERQPLEGRVVAVKAGQTIGRDHCDVVSPDPEVSRRHARLVEHDDGLGIADLGSLNGTYINGRRIDGLVGLRGGDVVQVGNTIWTVAAADSDTSAIAHAVERSGVTHTSRRPVPVSEMPGS